MTEGKYKKCVACQNFIPEQATVCMYCNAAQPEEKAKKKPGKLRTAIGVLILTFLGCMIVFALFPGNDDSNSSAVPTFTSTPNLAQFINTATPGPPVTPTSAVDDVRTAYLKDVGVQGDMLIDGMSQLGTLLSNANYTDQTWRLQVATAMGMIRAAHETLVDMTPPVDMQALHLRIIDATEDCSDATQLLARGLDNIDSALVSEAGTLVNRCTDKMNALTADLR